MQKCKSVVRELAKNVYQANRREWRLQSNLYTLRQTSDETSCSRTPNDITGKDVNITLNNAIYQSSYKTTPEKLVYSS